MDVGFTTSMRASDKPAFHRQYTIENHISTLYGVIEALDLRGITFYCRIGAGQFPLRIPPRTPRTCAAW